MRVRADPMRLIAAVVNKSDWTQTEAAGQRGPTQPRMNDLPRGRTSRFSINALLNIAAVIGRTEHFDLQALVRRQESKCGRRAASLLVFQVSAPCGCPQSCPTVFACEHGSRPLKEYIQTDMI